jgi:hypothetical protein
MYQPSFVIASDNTVIALLFIESMNFARDGEEQTLDKLRDDNIITVKTAGGSTYTLSARRHIEVLRGRFKFPEDPIELRDAIFERWVNIISK